MKKGLRIVITVLVLMLGLLGGFAFEKFRPKIDPMEHLSGEWTRSVDVSDRIVANAENWLEDVEGVTVTVEDLKETFGSLTIEVVERYVSDDAGYMVCQREVSKESYDACSLKAYEGMKKAFEGIIYTRLLAAGISTDEIEMDIQELYEEVIGMSMEEYLYQYGPVLVPSYEELSKEFTGAERKQVEE